MTATTGEQLRSIIGACDDLKIAEILGTGATVPEVIEAKRWAAGYQRTLGESQELRPSVVSRICDILGADEPDWDEH